MILYDLKKNSTKLKAHGCEITRLCISSYIFISCLSRTFCFPGAFAQNTHHTAHFLIRCPPWTQAALSSPLLDICHSTPLLQLALTTIRRPWPQAKQTACPLSAHPWHRLCLLLTDCRNYSQLNLLWALDISSKVL